MPDRASDQVTVLRVQFIDALAEHLLVPSPAQTWARHPVEALRKQVAKAAKEAPVANRNAWYAATRSVCSQVISDTLLEHGQELKERRRAREREPTIVQQTQATGAQWGAAPRSGAQQQPKRPQLFENPPAYAGRAWCPRWATGAAVGQRDQPCSGSKGCPHPPCAEASCAGDERRAAQAHFAQGQGEAAATQSFCAGRR